MAQRIIGNRDAQALFQAVAQTQGKRGYLPDVTPAFLQTLERRLAGSVGAATAHAMVGQITGAASVSVEDLMKVADEAAQIMEYSSQLEAKSAELERTARQLREANEKLTELSIQKDAFLSQISHELRTPMTSIRAFSEILMGTERMKAEDRARYSRIIRDEARRLTRLLDDLLDLSVLEHGKVSLRLETLSLSDVLDRAVDATEGQGPEPGIRIHRERGSEALPVTTDPDRLAQVFINIISNAQKYCTAERPELWIRVSAAGDAVTVDFVDNGRGIPRSKQGLIFEKFSRLTDSRAAGGAGLGLAICREVMDKLGGSISYLPGQGGAAFRVVLPRAQAAAA
jgi:signal transduction histidine kinase